MTMELWFIAALIPILSAAVLCYVFFRLVWAILRGIGSLLGLGGSRQVEQALGDGRGRADVQAAIRRGGRHVEVHTASIHGRRVCPGQDCRHVNVGRARFCAQCGRRLSHD